MLANGLVIFLNVPYVGFEKSDATFDWVDVLFNPDTSEWQYLSGPAVAKNDYKKIWVYASYYKNANTVYFDGIQLYKDEFGPSYTYDSKGNIQTTQSLAKQNSQFLYTDNDLNKYIDPKGSQFNYIYSKDGKHNLETATSAENVLYSFEEYDTHGNLKKSKVGDSKLFINSSANYKPSGNYIESVTDSSGNKVEYTYDETDGTLDTIKDPKEKTTSYLYDSNNRLTDVKKTVDNKEIVNSYAYDKDKIKTITHNGFNYTFDDTYESSVNKTTVSVGSQNLITNTYGTYFNATYNKNYQTGLLKESKYGNGQIVTNDYDNSDRVISRTFNNQQFKYSYDADGNLGYHEDLVNQVNYRYSYDLSNRLTKVWDNKGNILNYSFDANNNLSAIKDTINNGGTKTYSTYYAYDKDNKPTSVMFSRGTDSSNLDASLVAHYTFDNGDATDSSGHGNNGITHGNPNFVDSPRGKALKLSGESPAGLQWVEFNDFDVPDTFTVSLWLKPDSTADGQSFLGKHTDTGNNIFLMGYWDNGYEVAVRNGYYSSVGTGSKTADYQHLVAVVKKVDDTKSRVTVYKNNEELWSQEINGLIGSTKGKGWALGQDWDGSSVTDLFEGEIDDLAIYNRDLTANEVGYLYSSKSTINNKYDSIGRLETRSINSGANSFVTTYNYENVKEVDGVTTTTTKVKSIDNNGKSIAYTYDPNGNIKTITENDKIITYNYNELNELIREDNQVLNKTIVYSYDNGGNFDNKIQYPYTDPLTAPSGAINTISYTYGDANWKDKLTNFNGKTITYDAIGNPLTYDGYTYSWEWGRQLASMTGNGKTISYKYNDSGIRTQKTVNNITTNYHLVGDKVTYEDNGTDKIYYTHDSSGYLISMNITSSATPDINGEYYYIRNAQGDIIGLFDNAGVQVVSYSYDSWGKLLSINGTLKDTVGIKNPYRYREYRYDTETGLYYLQSRYYNPEWGRFINADGLAGVAGELLSHNMFAYCKNNPVNMVDYDGQFAWVLIPAIVAVAEVFAAVTAFVIIEAPVIINQISNIISTYGPQLTAISQNIADKISVNRSGGSSSSPDPGKKPKGNPTPSRSNYRNTFTKLNPNMPKNYQVHHTLPQKYESIMKNSGVNIHEVQFLRGVDPKIHSKITTEWIRWDKGLGRVPTAQEVIGFSNQINSKYGQYWYKP